MKTFIRLFRKIKSRLRYKLIIIYICIIAIPFTLSTYVTFNKFSAEIDRTYIENNLLVLQQLSRQLDDYLKEIDQFALSFYTLEFQTELESEREKLRKDSERLNQISMMFSQKREIESILYYKPLTAEAYYADKRNLKIIYHANYIEDEAWYKQLLRKPNDMMLIPTYNASQPANFQVADIPDVFTVNRTFSRNLLSRIYAVVSINLNTDYIAEISLETLGNQEESVVFLDRDGNLMYHSQSNPDVPAYRDVYPRIQQTGLRDGHLIYTDASEQRWMITYKQSNFFDSYIYKVIPVEALNEQAAYIRNFNIAVVMLVVLILILASLLVTVKITKPLSALEYAMRRAGEGDFKSFSEVMTTDEIGRMSVIFNKMLDKINHLITDKYVMELNYRMAQIKALQAQINPHFLYNTLQSIGSVALQEGLKDLYKMTNALSGFLRYSIKSGGENVTLDEELKNTERYLMIQKFRYEEKLHYAFEVDEKCIKQMIPKLTLQPIVENAVIHGLERKKGTGTVTVRCYRADDLLCLTVTDDGVGMDADTLERIREEIDSGDIGKPDRLGLINVIERLRLVVGEKCRMEIFSTPGEGTAVHLYVQIPSGQWQ